NNLGMDMCSLDFQVPAKHLAALVGSPLIERRGTRTSSPVRTPAPGQLWLTRVSRTGQEIRSFAPPMLSPRRAKSGVADQYSRRVSAIFISRENIRATHLLDTWKVHCNPVSAYAIGL